MSGILLAAMVVSGTAWSVDTPQQTFTFRHKPIDPRCVAALVPMEGNGPGSVKLATCTGPGKMTRNGQSVSIEEPDPDAGMRTPFDSYEVVARQGERYVLSTLSSGGGTGLFSTLMIVRRDRDQLTTERLFPGMGDRCNGGFAGAELHGNRLQWSTNITPYEVIDEAGIKLPDGDLLEDSAQSCVGTLESEYDFETGKTRVASETFTLSYFGGSSEAASGLLTDRTGWTDRFSLQHCFNLTYNSYVSAAHTVLSPIEMKTFGKDFAKTCLKKR